MLQKILFSFDFTVCRIVYIFNDFFGAIQMMIWCDTFNRFCHKNLIVYSP